MEPLFSTRKTLNLIPSTEKHRGEEEKAEGTSQSWGWGGREGKRKEGQRERELRLRHSALGWKAWTSGRASTTAARLTCPDSALGLSSSASEKVSHPRAALLVLSFRLHSPHFTLKGIVLEAYDLIQSCMIKQSSREA